MLGVDAVERAGSCTDAVATAGNLLGGRPALDGQHLATVADVAATKDSTIPALEALKERSARIEAEIRAGTRDEKLRGILILQADRDTSAGIVNRILEVTYAAGFPDVMFAVNRKSHRP